MKTLYVSDLDGTLLNRKSRLSENVLSGLNCLIEDGLLFTIATGRTYASTVPVIDGLSLRLPAVLLGGVYLFDMEKKQPLYIRYFEKETLSSILSLIEQAGATAALYQVDEEGNTSFNYDELRSQAARNYAEARAGFYRKTGGKNKVIERRSLQTICEKETASFLAVLDERKEVLYQLKEEFAKFSSVHSHFYIESGVGLTIELFPAGAGKNNGIRYVKELAGADRVVSFGDNFNDLAMKKESDLFCVPDNAMPKIKAHADIIIKSNTKGGVLQFIKDDLRRNGEKSVRQKM